jgi:uncharacterized membrane protein
MYHYGHMGYFGWFGMFLFWITFILLIIWFVQKYKEPSYREKTPIQIVQERYARGDIKEFEEIKKDLY